MEISVSEYRTLYNNACKSGEPRFGEIYFDSLPASDPCNQEYLRREEAGRIAAETFARSPQEYRVKYGDKAYFTRSLINRFRGKNLEEIFQNMNI